MGELADDIILNILDYCDSRQNFLGWSLVCGQFHLLIGRAHPNAIINIPAIEMRFLRKIWLGDNLLSYSMTLNAMLIMDGSVILRYST